MPPQAYGLLGMLFWNWRRDRAGKLTLSKTARRYPVAFLVGWGLLTAWIVPHVVRGEHVTDRIIRALNRLRP